MPRSRRPQQSVRAAIRSPVLKHRASPTLTAKQPVATDAHDDYQPVYSSSIWHAAQNGDMRYVALYLRSLTETTVNDINILNEAHESPLMIAASHNQLSVVAMLVQHPRCAINLQDRESGWTALHRACYVGHLSVASLLVQCRADPTIFDYDRMTAFDLLVTRMEPARFVTLPLYTNAGDSDSDDSGSGEADDDRQLATRHRQHREQLWSASLHNQLFAFGANAHLSMGVDSDGHIRKPTLVTAFSHTDVTMIAVTKLTSFVLTNTGDVYAMGQGSNHRLGIGTTTTVIQPRLVPMKTRVSFIDTCDRYSVALGSERGEVYVWGSFEWVDSGSGDQSTVSTVHSMPVKLDHCRHLRIVCASASQYRLCLVTDKGEALYIGHSIEDNKSVTNNPRLITAFTSIAAVAAVKATTNAVIVLTRDGEIYQLVRKERRAHRVTLRFSAASLSYSVRNTDCHSVSAVHSPSLSPMIGGQSLAQSHSKRHPRVIKISVSMNGERAIAVTNSGECYWWKPVDADAQSTTVSQTTSPPLRSLNSNSESGRRVAHLVLGLSHIRVIDACIGKGHTTVVSQLGDVYHFGPQSVLGSGGGSGKPQRIHYLHAATSVWCSDLHVFVTTVYHQTPRPTLTDAGSGTDTVLSLRTMCEYRMIDSIELSSLFEALSFSISLALPVMFDYCSEFVLSNLNILIHPLLKRMRVRDIAVLEAAYQRGRCGNTRNNDDDSDKRQRFVSALPLSAFSSFPATLAASDWDTVLVEEKIVTFSAAHDSSPELSEHSSDYEDELESDDDAIDQLHNGFVNLFAVTQRENRLARLKSTIIERRKQRRLATIDKLAAERANEADQAWRVGLTSDQIAMKLRAQLRAMKKKGKRVEKRTDTYTNANTVITDSSDVRALTSESRVLFVKMERIKNELRRLETEGCTVAGDILHERPLTRSPASSPLLASASASAIAQESTTTESGALLAVRPTAAAYDVALDRPLRVLARAQPKPSPPSTVREVKEDNIASLESLAVRAAPSVSSPIITPSKPATVKTWNISSSSNTESPLANTSAQPLSLFAAIQREQAEVESRKKASSSSTPRHPVATPSKSLVGSLASRASAAPAWASPTNRSLSAAATAATPLSLAQIQAEEQRRQQQQRQQMQRSATVYRTSPLAAAPAGSPAAASPFMLALSDFIPTHSPREQKSCSTPLHPKTWSAIATNSPSPSALSFRDIQNREQLQSQRFVLPSAPSYSSTGTSRSLLSSVSSPWGRGHAGMIDAPQTTSITAIQLAEEERRVEEERTAEAKRALEAQLADENARRARRRRERNPKANRDPSTATGAADPAGALAADTPGAPTKPTKTRPRKQTASAQPPPLVTNESSPTKSTAAKRVYRPKPSHPPPASRPKSDRAAVTAPSSTTAVH